MVGREHAVMVDGLYDREDGGFLYDRIPRERMVVQHRTQGAYVHIMNWNQIQLLQKAMSTLEVLHARSY